MCLVERFDVHEHPREDRVERGVSDAAAGEQIQSEQGLKIGELSVNQCLGFSRAAEALFECRRLYKPELHALRLHSLENLACQARCEVREVRFSVVQNELEGVPRWKPAAT